MNINLVKSLDNNLIKNQKLQKNDLIKLNDGEEIFWAIIKKKLRNCVIAKIDNKLLFDEDVNNRFEIYLDEVTEQMNKQPDWDLVMHNKQVARLLRKQYQKPHDRFLDKLENLATETYLTKQMINFLHNPYCIWPGEN